MTVGMEEFLASSPNPDFVVITQSHKEAFAEIGPHDVRGKYLPIKGTLIGLAKDHPEDIDTIFGVEGTNTRADFDQFMIQLNDVKEKGKHEKYDVMMWETPDRINLSYDLLRAVFEDTDNSEVRKKLRDTFGFIIDQELSHSLNDLLNKGSNFIIDPNDDSLKKFVDYVNGTAWEGTEKTHVDNLKDQFLVVLKLRDILAQPQNENTFNLLGGTLSRLRKSSLNFQNNLTSQDQTYTEQLQQIGEFRNFLQTIQGLTLSGSGQD